MTQSESAASVGELLADAPGGDQLRAHNGDAAHIALPAPVDKLLDELVELRRPEDAGRDGARQMRALVGELRGAVAGGELIGADDRHRHDPLNAGRLADLVQVVGGRGEELGGRLLLGGGTVAASITDTTPSRASESPSPVMTSTPPEREISTTSYP